jgi:hypothetical protein
MVMLPINYYFYSSQQTCAVIHSEESDDETGTEIQTQVTGDLIDSMTCELQKLRTENIDQNAQIQSVTKI